MTEKEIKTAAKCDYNYLWKCTHPSKAGNQCTGPCEKLLILGKPLTEEKDEKKV